MGINSVRPTATCSSYPKFNVLDASGAEVMHLEGKVFSLHTQFTIHDQNGAELGKIFKKIVKLIGEEFWVEKDGVEFMRIYGNFTEHDYQMVINGAALEAERISPANRETMASRSSTLPAYFFSAISSPRITS